jgi:hypothetical protein
VFDHRRGLQILRAAKIHEPAIVRFGGKVHIFERETLIATGPTIEKALDDGGFLPVPEGAVLPFAAEGMDVRKEGEHIATARSKTFALRIANALNAYTPGWRGY